MHEETPFHTRKLLQYKVNESKILPTSPGRSKGLDNKGVTKKMIYFDSCLLKPKIKLFKKIPNSPDYEKLRINYRKMVSEIEKNGGS